MKQRDRGALAAYQTALGAGRTDVQRRLRTEQEMIDIVRQEVDERRAAAESLGGAEPDAAQRLRHEASLLQALVVGTGPTPPGEDVTGL